MKTLKHILTESEFKNHNWQDIIKQLGGKFIHMHEDKSEVELMVKNTHYLIEHENGKIKICVVEDVNEFPDVSSDYELINKLKEIIK